MKRFILFAILLGVLPTSLLAQDDDLYFTPSPKVEKNVGDDVAESPTYYGGINKSENDYNRRYRVPGTYKRIGSDSLGNDIIRFRTYDGSFGIDTVYMADSYYYNDMDDYRFSRRMSRFDGFYGYGYYGSWCYPSPYYYRMGFYDPWVDDFYDPWYYGYGGYYGYYGYRRPWHYYGYYGYPYYYDSFYYSRPYYGYYWAPRYGYYSGRTGTQNHWAGSGSYSPNQFGGHRGAVINRGSGYYNQRRNTNSFGNLNRRDVRIDNRNRSYNNRFNQRYNDFNTPRMNTTPRSFGSGSFGGSRPSGGSFGGSRSGGSGGFGGHR